MLSILALLATTAFASPEKFIAVTGQCSRQSPPDRGEINLMVEHKEDSPSSATSKATKAYEKLRAEIKKLNLKDMQLQTSGFSVMPEYDYVGGKQKLRGYRASMGIQVETSEINRLGEVIEVAGKQGIQNASGLQTFMSPERAREVHESCLEEAVKNARLKAERMAKAGSAKIGDVLTIEEFKIERPGPPMPMAGAKMAFASAESAGGDAAPGIETRSETVKVTVHVSFALK